MERPGPHSLEAEQSLLSCCFLDGASIIARAIEAGISPESFYDRKHSLIFERLTRLLEHGQPTSLEVVAEELRDTGALDTVGGYEFLVEVSRRTPTTAEAAYFIARVHDAAVRRRLIGTMLEACDALRNDAHATEPVIVGLAAALGSADKDRGAGSRLSLWSPSEIIAYEPQSSACLLGDGYVERGEWTSLVGVGGLGKTRLALHLALCQITGHEWCGLPTSGEPARTVFLSTENGIRRWKQDLQRMFRKLETEQRALVEANLRILALTPDEDGDLCLSNPETVRRLKRTLTDAKPAMVVFDPFADMVDGDENKTADVVATLRTLRQVTRGACPSAAILIIHHARSGASNVAQAGDNFNAGNFGRGSKALFSRVRCELQLAPQDRNDPNRLVLACGKANNAAKFETRGLLFDPDTFTYSVDPDFDVDAWRNDVSGKRRTTAGISIAEIVEAVREIAPRPGDEATMANILEKLAPSGAAQRTTKLWVKKAVDAGYLRNGSKRSFYRLGPKPLSK